MFFSVYYSAFVWYDPLSGYNFVEDNSPCPIDYLQHIYADYSVLASMTTSIGKPVNSITTQAIIV